MTAGSIDVFPMPRGSASGLGTTSSYQPAQHMEQARG